MGLDGPRSILASSQMSLRSSSSQMSSRSPYEKYSSREHSVYSLSQFSYPVVRADRAKLFKLLYWGIVDIQWTAHTWSAHFDQSFDVCIQTQNHHHSKTANSNHGKGLLVPFSNLFFSPLSLVNQWSTLCHYRLVFIFWNFIWIESSHIHSFFFLAGFFHLA